MSHVCRMPAIFRPLSLLLIILAAIPNSHAQENQAAPGKISRELVQLDKATLRNHAHFGVQIDSPPFQHV